MSNLVNRNKRSLFKKRHYVAIIRKTTEYLTRCFGYKRKPFVFESVNSEGALMTICSDSKNRYFAIFYDYMQWKNIFGYLSFEEQAASVMHIIAHEMRHYYQLRQIDSKHPNQPDDRLTAWRNNYENMKYVSDDFSVFDFYMQPTELDAELFAYVFVADQTDLLQDTAHIGESYIKELEEYYVKLCGETDDELFPKESTEGCISY